jgi:hypothetical protein
MDLLTGFVFRGLTPLLAFAALLGSPDNGHWRIAPKATRPKVSRRYRESTLVLETEFSAAEGTVVLIDCMDRRGGHQDVIRLVRGIPRPCPHADGIRIEFRLRNRGSLG